jgi:hypothetical protein
LRRRTRTAIGWLLLSTDRTGLSGVSSPDAPPPDAPLFKIDDLGGGTEPITIRHGGALSNRRIGRLSFLQVDCGALQLAGIDAPETAGPKFSLYAP